MRNRGSHPPHEFVDNPVGGMREAGVASRGGAGTTAEAQRMARRAVEGVWIARGGVRAGRLRSSGGLAHGLSGGVARRVGLPPVDDGGVDVTLVLNGLDELKARAGTELGRSDWLQVTQERVNTFADATGDHQWIHVDLDAARSGPFGGTIAHGYLTLSLVIPMFGELLSVQGIRMGINYGLNRVRFPTPVPVGSRIRLAAAINSVEKVGGGALQAEVDLTVELEGSEKPACVAQAIYRYYA
jgi:acyl dehydratase